RLRIDDDAVADDAGHAGMQDAGRDEMQDELLALHVDRVACVVSALISRHDGEARGQQVDNLPLAFVAPLGAQNHNVHESVSLARILSRDGWVPRVTANARS